MWVKNLEERDRFEELGVDSKLLSGFTWLHLAQCRQNGGISSTLYYNYKFNGNPGISCVAQKL
jgi:hypothetical protein